MHRPVFLRPRPASGEPGDLIWVTDAPSNDKGILQLDRWGILQPDRWGLVQPDRWRNSHDGPNGPDSPEYTGGCPTRNSNSIEVTLPTFSITGV